MRCDATRFCDRYPGLWRYIDRKYPGLWNDLGDALQVEHARQYTTRGAVVREMPRQREAATQTERRMRSVCLQVGSRSSLRATTATQTDRRMRSVGLQVGRVTLRTTTATQTEAGAPSEHRRVEESTTSEFPGAQKLRGEPDRQERPRGGPDEVERCWACGSAEHFAHNCPSRARSTFCYRCGQKGVSVRQCTNCREGWRQQGPYSRRLESHPGGEPVLKRGGRPGTRKREGSYGAERIDPRLARCTSRWPPCNLNEEDDSAFRFVRR